MSVPRLRRTVAVDPVGPEPVGEGPQRRRRRRVPAESVGGVERDEVHVGAADARERAEQTPEHLGLRRRVVHPLDAGVLEGDPPSLGAGELGRGVEHLGDRVAAVERHQLRRARRRSRACSDTASVTGSASPARRRMAGTTPTVLMVMRRAESPRSWWMRSTAAQVLS